MPRIIRWLDRKLYPGITSEVSDARFREVILEAMGPRDQVLDLGAGAGIVESMNFKGLCERICGVDLDPRILNNPYLDEAKIAAGESIPYPENTFDLVISNNVVEHLTAPQEVLADIARVLKPGGRFAFKTPNKLHYIPLIARLSPHWIHERLNEYRGRNAEDTFPTVYAMNTEASVRRIALKEGLAVNQILLIESRPGYLRFSWPTYLLGCIYERWVNHVPGFARFRAVLIAELQKTG